MEISNLEIVEAHTDEGEDDKSCKGHVLADGVYDHVLRQMI